MLHGAQREKPCTKDLSANEQRIRPCFDGAFRFFGICVRWGRNQHLEIMTRLDAFGIYSNPEDLQISALPNKEDGNKLFVLIAYGPDRKFRWILSGQTEVTDRKEVFERAILPYLEMAITEGKKSGAFNHEKCMSQSHLDWIRDQLVKTGVANTFEMVAMQEAALGVNQDPGDEQPGK